MEMLERLCDDVAVIAGGLAAGEVGDLRGETSLEDVFVDLLGARDWGQGRWSGWGRTELAVHPAPQQSPARNRVDAAPDRLSSRARSAVGRCRPWLRAARCAPERPVAASDAGVVLFTFLALGWVMLPVLTLASDDLLDPTRLSLLCCGRREASFGRGVFEVLVLVVAHRHLDDFGIGLVSRVEPHEVPGVDPRADVLPHAGRAESFEAGYVGG